jgi:hypothetical protein
MADTFEATRVANIRAITARLKRLWQLAGVNPLKRKEQP